MMKIGLTGNIGSGKSLVAQIFTVLGVPVYHADDESKKFLTTSGVIDELVEKFGPGILSSDGQVDRRALAAIVFADAEALQWLNALLHPRVREDFRQWASLQSDSPYVVQEAAIIFESGFNEEYDRIIHISCPKGIALERVIKRDQSDRRMVLERMQFQWKDAKKASLSDEVILNDGTKAILPQVLAIHEKILHSIHST